MLLLGLALAPGTVAVLGTPAPLRRRLLALLAPVAATMLVTRVAFDSVAFLARRFLPVPTGLGPIHWLVLALIPPLTLAVAVAAVHRRERTQHLLALGRAADRQASAGSGPAR